MATERGQNGALLAQDVRATAWAEAGVGGGETLRGRSAMPAASAADDGALGLGLLAFVFIVLLVCALWAGSGVYAHAAHEQGAIALRESILRAANQCYAVEGAYPASLGYLEKRYGLTVNASGYDVTYEAFASNIAPTVVVRAL